jgi:hypothetical protein
MSASERKGIAGFAGVSELSWGWFGSMYPAGKFKHVVNANSVGLSRALDAIPPRGQILKEHYLDFVGTYVEAFPQKRGHGLHRHAALGDEATGLFCLL